jgi:putative isomerase
LIQAVRSRTAEGFVPNYSAGGGKSVDRTEPPLAGRVLHQLHAKFNDTWIVEFLLDDLLDNLDWFWRKRVTPLGLIALGSDPVVNYTGEVGGVGCMQGARWESGLDNSPMYEGPPPWFDNVTHHMEGADVGMSSLFVAEAAAVAALARAVNRSGDADALDARAGSVRAQISTHLWDEARGIFVNRFAIGANTSLSSRVSPTSFYALSARAATDAQAARMASEWLLNATRFCLSETWPAGVSPGCFWGLPSISADDPAFGGWYWRGSVWGPMAQLVFWALGEYAHVPEVAAAKAALAKQHGAMFLEQWLLHHNVCENYSQQQGVGECTGTPFYSWGALGALLELQERGMY